MQRYGRVLHGRHEESSTKRPQISTALRRAILRLLARQVREFCALCGRLDPQGIRKEFSFVPRASDLLIGVTRSRIANEDMPNVNSLDGTSAHQDPPIGRVDRATDLIHPKPVERTEDIGVATSASLDGPWVRRDAPVFGPGNKSAGEVG